MKENNSKNNGLNIVLIIVGLLLLLVGVYFGIKYFTQDNSGNDNSSNQNSSNIQEVQLKNSYEYLKDNYKASISLNNNDMTFSLELSVENGYQKLIGEYNVENSILTLQSEGYDSSTAEGTELIANDGKGNIKFEILSNNEIRFISSDIFNDISLSNCPEGSLFN